MNEVFQILSVQMQLSFLYGFCQGVKSLEFFKVTFQVVLLFVEVKLILFPEYLVLSLQSELD